MPKSQSYAQSVGQVHRPRYHGRLLASQCEQRAFDAQKQKFGLFAIRYARGVRALCEKGMAMDDAKERRAAPLKTPTDLGSNATRDLTGALNALLADVFALYLKTKNFHWHVSGSHFRDYHLLFDEQADQIFAITDEIAERVRKIGGRTLHSIGNIARLQRLADNDADYVEPRDMLAELRSDNQALITSMRAVHELCAEENDVATTSLIENWIDQAERRVWFLYEAGRSV
jgi:starvation-inducible DNA-binding protein